MKSVYVNHLFEEHLTILDPDKCQHILYQNYDDAQEEAGIEFLTIQSVLVSRNEDLKQVNQFLRTSWQMVGFVQVSEELESEAVVIGGVYTMPLYIIPESQSFLNYERPFVLYCSGRNFDMYRSYESKTEMLVSADEFIRVGIDMSGWKKRKKNI